MQALMSGVGLIAETVPRAHVITQQIMIDGTVYFGAIGLSAGDVVTRLSINVTTGATVASLSKVGLYASDGTRLAVSADQGASWESAGLKTITLTAAYSVVRSDLYYVAAVSKAAVLPTISRGASNANLSASVNSGMLPWGQQTGQTDLPSPATIASGGVYIPWIGVT